jgi:hypothetical protein
VRSLPRADYPFRPPRYHSWHYSSCVLQSRRGGVRFSQLLLLSGCGCRRRGDRAP